MKKTAQTGSKTGRPRKRGWLLAVALLGTALISHAGVAAEVKQFQDGQGTIHIANPGGAEPGKAGAGPKPARRQQPPREASPEALQTPQAQETPPEQAAAPPPVKEPPREPVTAPPAEEEEPLESVRPPLEARSPAGSQEGEPAAIEPQSRAGRSIGRSGGGGGGGMRGRR